MSAADSGAEEITVKEGTYPELTWVAVLVGWPSVH